MQRCGSCQGLGFGLGSSLTAVRSWLTRGDGGQLGVVLIRAVGGAGGDDTDLIHRQPALSHPCRAAGKLLEPVRDSGNGVRGRGRGTQLPGHHSGHRTRPGHAAQIAVIQLGDELHNAPIDRITLPSQLRQLLEQHLETLLRTEHRGVEDITPS